MAHTEDLGWVGKDAAPSFNTPREMAQLVPPGATRNVPPIDSPRTREEQPWGIRASWGDG